MRRIALFLFAAAAAFAQVYPINTQPATAAWTSATAGGAVGTGAALLVPTQGFNGATVALNQGSTIAAGVVSFEVSNTPDATVTNNWYALQCTAIDTGTPASTYTLQASTKKAFVCPTGAWPRFEVRLSTAITGSATVNVSVTLNSISGIQPPAAATAPVSGTVTANQGTAGGAAWPTSVNNFPATVDVNVGAPGSNTPRVAPAIVGASSTASWTSATSLNTTLSTNMTGFNAINVSISCTSTVTGGAVTFEASDDGTPGTGTTFYNQILSETPFRSSGQEAVFTLVASTNTQFRGSTLGNTTYRTRLSTAITGTATCTVTQTPVVMPVPQSLLSALLANTVANPAVIAAPVSNNVGSNGSSMSLQNALSTTVKTVKASASGSLYGVHCLTTVVSYIQIFDVATSGGVTLGTTTPNLSLGGPANGLIQHDWTAPIGFSNGIQVAATTTATGSSAPATAADCNFIFK